MLDSRGVVGEKRRVPVRHNFRLEIVAVRRAEVHVAFAMRRDEEARVESRGVDGVMHGQGHRVRRAQPWIDALAA
jgi:hypothetical protein